MRANSVAPVVVGVDGSPSSVRAVPLAAYEAATQNRPLCMLHAFNWIPAYPGPGGGWSRQAAEQLLDQAERAARERAPDVVADSVIVEGPAVSALLHTSRDAALVVIGDGNLTQYLTLPVEATSMRVAAHAECSVMLVREAAERAGPVLVGVDGSIGGEHALGFAFDAAAQRDTELIVVHVVEEDDDPTTAEAAAARARAGVAQWLQKYPGVVVRQREIQGDPGQVLTRESAEAVMLVVGARGERPSQGLLGAVCVSVVHHAPCPVVVVRGGHQRDDG